MWLVIAAKKMECDGENREYERKLERGYRVPFIELDVEGD